MQCLGSVSSGSGRWWRICASARCEELSRRVGLVFEYAVEEGNRAYVSNGYPSQDAVWTHVSSLNATDFGDDADRPKTRAYRVFGSWADADRRGTSEPLQ